MISEPLIKIAKKLLKVDQGIATDENGFFLRIVSSLLKKEML